MNNINEKLEEIVRILRSEVIHGKKFLTLEELTLYLGQSKSNIYKLTSLRAIPYYCPSGKKIYFKRVEIDEWIEKSKIMSDGESVSTLLSKLSKNI